jgi:hypothetical protein
MIVQITLKTETETWSMLFGDSYKSWSLQFQEYLWNCRRGKKFFTVENVSVCKNEKWLANGLKRCEVSEYQNELDEAGVNRKFEHFEFTQNSKIEREVRKFVGEVFEVKIWMKN